MTDEERNGPEETFHDTERKLRDRIEALTAENKRLGQQCEGLMQAGMNNGQALILAEAKLAKAVEGLRGFMSKVDTACLVERDHPQAEFADAWRDAYAIIAEIEGEKG
jgi:hypothetical protein